MIPLQDEAEADKVACFERPPRKYDSSADVPWVCNLYDEFRCEFLIISQIQDEHLVERGVD